MNFELEAEQDGLKILAQMTRTLSEFPTEMAVIEQEDLTLVGGRAQPEVIEKEDVS